MEGPRIPSDWTRSGPVAMPPWIAAAGGIFCLSAAFFCASLAGGGQLGPERVLVRILAALCAIVGTGALGISARWARNRARLRRARREHPGEPWRADFPWSGPLFPETWAGPILLSLFLTLASSAVVGFFAWGVTALEPDGDAPDLVLRVFKGFVTLLFLIPLVTLIWFLGRVGHLLRFGVTRVRLAEPPARTGRRMECTLLCRFRPARAALVRARLRCIQVTSRVDVTMPADRSRPRRTVVAVGELWGETRAPGQIDPGAGGSTELRFAFDIPSGLPPTALSGVATTYWEIACFEEKTRSSFKPVILLPVY